MSTSCIQNESHFQTFTISSFFYHSVSYRFLDDSSTFIFCISFTIKLAVNHFIWGNLSQSYEIQNVSFFKQHPLLDDDVDIPDSEECNQGQITNKMFEMHRKNLSQALYSHWIIEELKDRKKIGKVLFGPRYNDVWCLVTYQGSVDKFLDNVDAWRTEELYKHEVCTGMFI